MTTTMMMRKLVMMMAMKVGDIYEDKLGTADETCLDGLYANKVVKRTLRLDIRGSKLSLAR